MGLRTFVFLPPSEAECLNFQSAEAGRYCTCPFIPAEAGRYFTCPFINLRAAAAFQRTDAAPSPRWMVCTEGQALCWGCTEGQAFCWGSFIDLRAAAAFQRADAAPLASMDGLHRGSGILLGFPVHRLN
jgi:hypothetical protein